MAQYHEIQLINVNTHEVVEKLVINDDFLDYVGQESVEAFKLLDRIPVLFPYQGDFQNLSTFKTMTPTKKGVCIASTNILNQYSFQDFSYLVELWRRLVLSLEGDFYFKKNNQFTEEERQTLTTEAMIEMTKHPINKVELVENINKLSKIVNELSVSHESYILVWEGI